MVEISDDERIAEPSAWVRRFLPLIPAGGRVLDLACGRGRHARLLAAAGYSVEAVDRDEEALAGLAGVGNVATRIADLEGGPWPYFGQVFEGVVVTNYLNRRVMPNLLGMLGPNGVLICETFMVGNERLGRPSDPAFLLRPGELLEVVRQRLAVVAFEQGEVESPRPAVVQRICAVRGPVVRLPAAPL